MTTEADKEVRRAYALDPEAGKAARMLEQIGAKVPGPPEPGPKVKVEGPAAMTTEPPPLPKEPPLGPDEEEVLDEAPLEELPSPGASLE